MLCEKPLKRWIHVDGSKLSIMDSVKIVGQLAQIAWVYGTKINRSKVVLKTEIKNSQINNKREFKWN